jgi:hypothetical protein
VGKSPDFAVPADPDVVHLEQPREHTAGELTTLIGVEDLWATVAVEGFPHGLQTEVGGQVLESRQARTRRENQSITANR